MQRCGYQGVASSKAILLKDVCLQVHPDMMLIPVPVTNMYLRSGYHMTEPLRDHPQSITVDCDVKVGISEYGVSHCPALHILTPNYHTSQPFWRASSLLHYSGAISLVPDSWP